MRVVNLSHTIVTLRSRQCRSLVAQVSVTKCSKNKLTSSMEKGSNNTSERTMESADKTEEVLAVNVTLLEYNEC